MGGSHTDITSELTIQRRASDVDVQQ